MKRRKYAIVSHVLTLSMLLGCSDATPPFLNPLPDNDIVIPRMDEYVTRQTRVHARWIKEKTRRYGPSNTVLYHDMSGVGSKKEGLRLLRKNSELYAFQSGHWKPIRQFKKHVSLLYAVDETLYAAGTTIYKREGATWQEMMLPCKASIQALWGTSNENLYAAGKRGLLLHYDGKTWQKISLQATDDFQAVGGCHGRVYLAGEWDKILYAFDCASWAKMPKPFAEDDVDRPRVDGNRVFELTRTNGAGILLEARTDDDDIVHYHCHQRTVTKVPMPTKHLVSVFSNEAPRLFGVSSEYDIWEYDGQSWNVAELGSAMVAVWGADETHLYALGRQGSVFIYTP